MNAIRRVYFWLGQPSRYNSQRDDLEGLPDKDLGGREMVQPESNDPAKMFDATMPAIYGLHAQAVKQAATTGQMPPLGWVTQALQVVWCFTSQEVSSLRTELVKANQQIAELQSAVRRLKESVDASAGDD